eukprot:364100-Chlamydomonas_euryale.AAC.9
MLFRLLNGVQSDIPPCRHLRLGQPLPLQEAPNSSCVGHVLAANHQIWLGSDANVHSMCQAQLQRQLNAYSRVEAQHPWRRKKTNLGKRAYELSTD